MGPSQLGTSPNPIMQTMGQGPMNQIGPQMVQQPAAMPQQQQQQQQPQGYGMLGPGPN